MAYEETDDAKNLLLAADREAVEYEGEKIAKPLREANQAKAAEPLKMASFGEAFKEARGRGDKTFEYMGKKYTTDLASEKKPAPKKSPTSAAMADGNFAERQTYKRAMQARQKNERRKAMGLKSGGSVKSSASKRADGCAQRGKTRGRIV